MAEDKQKEGEAAAGGKKKGLSAIVMIAVGAVLGGAGVVVALPPKKIEVPVEKPPPKIQPIKHPDVMEVTFNPQAEAGKAFGSIKFKFVYEVREDLEEAAHKQLADNWDRAKNDCLMMLCARTSREIGDPAGKRAVVKALLDTLDAALFPDDGHKLARVTEVLVSDLMVQ